MPKVTPLEKRFMDKVDKQQNGCWYWTAYKVPDGYGMVRTWGKMELSHRVSYKMWCGEIPENHYVCHTCDNPSCVNPDHLFIGTQKENMRDCISKGRLNSSIGTHSYIEEGLENIRKHYEQGYNTPSTVLAKRYSLTKASVHSYLAGGYKSVKPLNIPIPVNQFLKTFAYHGVRRNKGARAKSLYKVWVRIEGDIGKSYGTFNDIHEAARVYNRVVTEKGYDKPLNTIWEDFSWKPKVLEE